MNRTTDLRRSLGLLRRRVTGADREALHTRVAELSGEVSTLAAQVQCVAPDSVRRVDVAVVSDFRLRGGTTASIAEEVRAQSAAGLSTALIHAQSAVTTTVTGFSRNIQSVMGLPDVHVVSPRAELDAELLVIRHPTVMGTSVAGFGRISADQVVLVANHPAIDADGTWHYSVADVDQTAYEKFGVRPEWAPISPVVRASLLDQKHPELRIVDHDWANIFGQEVVTTPRTGFVAAQPVIGRHSRPEKEKWPATGRDILAAYPADGHYQVEVLGGAGIPEEILGETPDSWHVQPFGAEPPEAFLKRIDFWVYMHHPGWKEAFGRAIMEALAAGCLVVLPPYLQEIFGPAALYAEPGEVTGIVDHHWKNKEAFLEQSRRGQQFAVDHGPGRHLERLRWRGVSAV